MSQRPGADLREGGRGRSVSYGALGIGIGIGQERWQVRSQAGLRAGAGDLLPATRRSSASRDAPLGLIATLQMREQNRPWLSTMGCQLRFRRCAGRTRQFGVVRRLLLSQV